MFDMLFFTGDSVNLGGSHIRFNVFSSHIFAKLCFLCQPLQLYNGDLRKVHKVFPRLCLLLTSVFTSKFKFINYSRMSRKTELNHP